MLLFITAMLTQVAPVLAAEPLEAGIVEVDITPPRPYRMSGYFSERLSTGVLDPLLAKAIVFRQGRTSCALVFCDLIGISPAVSAASRREAEALTGIPAEHIAIIATHSHTGPLYFGALRKHFHDRMVESTGSDRHERVDYPAELVRKLVEAIRRAAAAVVPVRIAAGSANEPRLSFNRRFHMSNGSVRFNPGQQNPDIVRPAGPIDPEVGLVRIEADGRTTAAITSFALHLDTVGGTRYSADFPRHLADRLAAESGRDFHSLFGTGTCGDINHVDVSIKGRRSADLIGSMLADTVLERLGQLPVVLSPSLGVAQGTVDVPLQRFSAADLTRARKNMLLVDSRTLPFLDRVRAYATTAVEQRGGRTIAIEVQVFRLGPELAIVTLPGEVFVELGLAIKQGSPFDTTLVIELTNDAPGYLPTTKAFAEGSYETVNSRIQPGGGEATVRLAVRLLRELGE